MTSGDTSDGYAGQQGLTDSSSPYNATQFQILQAMAKISTMKIVKVMKVTNAGDASPVGMVDIMPMVNQMSGDGKATPHATIFNVPYFRLSGGKNAVIMDPVIGDLGMAMISDRDMSNVVQKKGQANPASYRKYDAADSVYIGGILGGTPEQYITFTNTGIKIVDKNGAIIETKVGPIIEITGNVVIKNNLQIAGAIQSDSGGTYAGNFQTSGDIISGNINLKTHHHTAQGATAPTTAAQP